MPAAAGGAAFKGITDLERGAQDVEAWDKSLVSEQKALKAKFQNPAGWIEDPVLKAKYPIDLKEAQRLIDVYSADGSKVLQRQSILGIPAASFTKLHARIRTLLSGMATRKHWRDNPTLRPDDLKRLLMEQQRGLEASLHHYDIFRDARSPEELRGHMLDKAISRSFPVEHANSKIFTPELKRILFSPNLSIEERLAQVHAQAPTLFQGDHAAAAQGIDKLVRQAVLGIHRNGQLSTLPEHTGEAVRLIGNRGGIVSTPSIYKHMVSGFLNKARAVKYPLALGGMAASVPMLLKAFQPEQPKQAAAAPQKNELPMPAQALGMGSLAGGGLFLGQSGWNDIADPGLKRIGVTYGRTNIEGAHLGSGHMNPAQAMKEALKQRMAERGMNFSINDIARDANGIVAPPRKSFNTIFNTGFGLHSPQPIFSATQRSHGFDVKPHVKARTLINYLTDPLPDDVAAFGATAGDRLPGANTIMAGYGSTFNPKTIAAHRSNPDFRKAMKVLAGDSGRSVKMVNVGPDSMPVLLTDDARKTVGAMTSRDASIAAIEEALTHPKTSPEMQVALKNVLADARAGKHVITISGGGRGDYVTARALELADELKTRGLQDRYSVVAQMGGALKDDRQINALAGRGVHLIGMTPQTANVALQNIDTHLMSTGASSAAEAAGGRGILGLPSKGVWGFEQPWDMISMKPGEGRITEGTWASKTRDLLAKAIGGTPKIDDQQANVQGWNRGMAQLLERFKGGGGQPNRGMFSYDSMGDVIDNLENKPNLMRMVEGAARRGPEELRKIEAGRQTIADLVLNTARKNVWKARGLGAAKLGLGGAALGAAGLGTSKLMDGWTRAHIPSIAPTLPPAASADPGMFGGHGALVAGGGAAALLALLAARRRAKKKQRIE